jgi:multiple RNA-binding domain-containing protein 1
MAQPGPGPHAAPPPPPTTLQVIAQTKQALGDAGVDIAKLEAAAAASGKASLSKSVARSGTVLLLKNLQWATSEEELLDLCSR